MGAGRIFGNDSPAIDSYLGSATGSLGVCAMVFSVRKRAKTNRKGSIMMITYDSQSKRAVGFFCLLTALLSFLCVGCSPGAGNGAISGYTLGDAGGTQSLVAPHFSTASLIVIKNLSNAPTTLAIEYSDLTGVDKTPAQNTYELAAGATIHWAPLANDVEVEGPAGSAVPDMTGNTSEGSAIISSTEPVAGHLEIYLEDGSTSAYRLGGIGEATNTLGVPYFGTASFICVRNVAKATNTIAIEYRDLAGVDQTPAQHMYELAAGATVRWAPLVNDPGIEGVAGAAVPDMTGGASEGSAIISSTAPLAGQLEGVHGAPFSGYTLGYISGSTKSKPDFFLAVPYFRTGSLIAIRNLESSTANFAVQYFYLSDGTPFVSSDELPASATKRWSPFVDVPGFAETEGCAIITADRPLIGHLEQSDGDGPNTAYRLSDSNEWTSSLVVPYFRPDSFISIMNLGVQATTLMVEYRDLAGVDHTPAQNTYELAVGATVRWAPLVNDPGIEGVAGAAVPDMTGGASEGSAIINSLQIEPIVGQLELGPGVSPYHKSTL